MKDLRGAVLRYDKSGLNAVGRIVRGWGMRALWILVRLKKLTCLMCPPGLFISVFPSIRNRTKKASLFPSSTDVCGGDISCTSSQLRCLGFLRKNRLLMCSYLLPNARMEGSKMGLKSGLQLEQVWNENFFLLLFDNNVKVIKGARMQYLLYQTQDSSDSSCWSHLGCQLFLRGGFTEVSSRVDFKPFWISVWRQRMY